MATRRESIVMLMAGDHGNREMESDRGRAGTAELQSLYNIASLIAGPAPIEDKQFGVLRELAGAADAYRCNLWAPDEEAGHLRLVLSIGGSQRSPEAAEGRRSGRLTVSCWTARKPIIVNDYAGFPGARPDLVAEGIRSVALFPVALNAGRTGVVGIQSKERGHFSPERSRVLAVGGGS